MNQLPYDMRLFNADPMSTRRIGFNCIIVIMLVAILSWMGNRDHEHKLAQLEEASAATCHQHKKINSKGA